MSWPAKPAEARALGCSQPHKEENTRLSRKLVQSPSIWRSGNCSKPLAGDRIANAIRPPCSARTEEREISRTVRGDVSTLRLHRSSSSGITHSATKGHTFFLIGPGKNTIRRGSASDATVGTILPTRIPYENRQSKGCISKNDGVSSPSAKRHAPRHASRREQRNGARSVHSLREQRASRLRGQVYSLCLSQTNRIAAES